MELEFYVDDYLCWIDKGWEATILSVSPDKIQFISEFEEYVYS